MLLPMLFMLWSSKLSIKSANVVDNLVMCPSSEGQIDQFVFLCFLNKNKFVVKFFYHYLKWERGFH